MKSILASLFATLLALPLLSHAGDKIPFRHLPPYAQAAVLGIAPGIRVKEVEVKERRGWTYFEVEGRCSHFDYEIEVSPSGQILKFERDQR